MDYIIRRYRKSSTKMTVSRYQKLDIIIDDEGDEYVESYEPINLEPQRDDGYHQVTASESNRLDLISYNLYGTPMLYWVLAEANNIYDPTSVPAGTLLRAPSRSRIFGFKGVLS